MESNNVTLLLREKDMEPSNEVLENVMAKDLFMIYQELMDTFIQEFSLEPQWNFYKDGNSWLCKVVYKKKTILWLSVWENCIKTGFYFTDKNKMGVLELDIDKNIKKTFEMAKPIGKLLPLTFEINHQKQIKDLKEVIRYKKELK